MRVEDAPPAGWYPDPEGGSRLRFWEGTDWSDRYRAPPTAGVMAIQEAAAEQRRIDYQEAGGYVPPVGRSRQETEEIISQVRQAARAEAERAAHMFRQEVRGATSSISPLISEYTSKITRWFRILSVIAIILLIGWVAFQIFAQVSMFEWIGDRIDNLTDNDAGAAVFRLPR